MCRWADASVFCPPAAVIGLFLGLAWLFFSMRMYVKTFLTKGWGVDDFFLIVGIVGSRSLSHLAYISGSDFLLDTVHHIFDVRGAGGEVWDWKAHHGYPT